MHSINTAFEQPPAPSAGQQTENRPKRPAPSAGQQPSAKAAEVPADWALEAAGLSVRYEASGPPVLDQVSLALAPGRFYLLSGPSGGGKSTLLAALNGTLSLSENGLFTGEIKIKGQPAAQAAAERALSVGSVLQDANSQIIFPAVEDELAFPLENLQFTAEKIGRRIRRAAEVMKLRPEAATDKLSGGQKQRLITAATLGMGQKILLFDEPLASLDAAGAELLLKHLSKLVRDEDYTVLFVEHRIDWVLPYADAFFWLENGKLQSFPDAAAFEAFFSQNIREKLRTPRPLPPAAAAAERTLIALEDVSFKAGGRVILEQLNFRLHAGDRYVILGENGAGKSTFLLLLSGLLKPSSGRRRSVYKRRESFRKIGFVMQDPGYQLFLPTVGQELAFQSADPAVTARLIEIFRFEELLARHPHSLSEGQKRRLGFAVILSMLPEVLFLDEPTVGQDYFSLQAMLEALSEIYAKRPLTLLTLTHDSRCGAFFGFISE